MAGGTIDNGTYSGSEQVGYYTRSTTTDIGFPATSVAPLSWNGQQRIGVHSLGFPICEESGGINLYAKVGFSGYGGSGTSAVLALPGYAATPAVKAFAVGPVYFAKSGTTAFNITVNVYTNSAGTSRPDNLYNTSANDDTRMGLRSGVSGSYYATLSYWSVPDAPTSIAVTSGTSNKPAGVTYTAPANGGTAITGYTTIWQTSNTWSTAGGWTSGNPTTGTFASNTVYYFNVIATNAVGDSPYGTADSWYYRTITLNANGGSSTPSPLYPNDGASIALPAAISREGYRLDGWNTAADGSGTTYAAGASYTAAGDVTLYAKWTPVTPMVHNGTSFVRAAKTKVWNGSAWVSPAFKVWNGSTWTDPK